MTIKNKVVIIDENLCIGCGVCVSICPKKILYIDKNTDRCAVTDEKKCGKSGCCQKICPVKAIKII